jgi:uncharacterized Tic20 family protein
VVLKYFTKQNKLLMQQNTLLGDELEPEITPNSDERTMAILSHILTIVFPLLAPLIIYLIKKDESRFIAYHAKESLNFQITMLLIIILLFISIIGILLVWIVGIVSLVLVIIATIKASEGKLYRYPISWRIIK